MSGIAFSTLAIFCALIPGFAYQFSYYRTTAHSETGGQVDLGSAKSVVIAVLISLPIHALWVGSIGFIDERLIPIGRVNFSDVLPILQGEAIPEGSSLASQIDGLLLLKVSTYLVTQSLVAMLFGFSIAKLSDYLGWGRLRALATDGAIWHTKLAYPENDPDGIIVSVTVSLGDITYLYYGLLDEYHLTPSGELKYLVLLGAARRNMAAPEEDAYILPGEYFVIDCRGISTIDVDYFWMSPTDEQDEESDYIEIRIGDKTPTPQFSPPSD